MRLVGSFGAARVEAAAEPAIEIGARTYGSVKSILDAKLDRRPAPKRPAVSVANYVRSNKSAIINYGARYRSGRRIATALAESAVNSLVARRMVEKQQMQWSKRGAPLLVQVRAAVFNGDLRERLAYKPPNPSIEDRVDIRTDAAAAQDRMTPRLI